MSTRGVYTFRSENNGGDSHVYRHCDNYPSGAAEALIDAMKLAWPPPRFEADEFAAAFVAANKGSPGNLRVPGSGQGPHQIAGDAAYWYVVESRDDEIFVTAYKVNWRGEIPEQTKIWAGELPKMAAWAEKYESETA